MEHASFALRGSSVPLPRSLGDTSPTPLSSPGLHPRRCTGLPGSWGILCVHASLQHPGGTSATIWPCYRLGVAFRKASSVSSHESGYFGTQDAAYTLAVYASQPRLPVNVQPRKTRYRPVAFPSRVGISAHWIPLKSFGPLLLGLPPFPGFAWRDSN